MEDKKIEKFTKILLEIEYDGRDAYSFLCALANARSLIENKLAIQAQQTMAKIAMKSLFSMVSKNS